MNNRNVEALTALMLEWLASPAAPNADLPETDEEAAREAASFLAARGALVPSALTDEDCASVWSEGVNDYNDDHGVDARYGEPSRMRTDLERIARGDD
jgi:hypothetical protein